MSEGKKQKPKPGRVVRLNPDLALIIELERLPGETISATVRRLLGVSAEVRYVLPSDLYEDPADARGASVLRSVRSGSKKKIEQPVRVKL